MSINPDQHREVLSLSLNTQFNLSEINDVLDDKNYLEVVLRNGTFQIRKQVNHQGAEFYEVRRILDRIGELAIERCPVVIMRTEKKPRDIMFILTRPEYGFGEYPGGDFYMFKFENGLSYYIRLNPVHGEWAFNGEDVGKFEGDEIGSFFTEEEAKEFARNFMDYLYLPDDELIKKHSVKYTKAGLIRLWVEGYYNSSNN